MDKINYLWDENWEELVPTKAAVLPPEDRQGDHTRWAQRDRRVSEREKKDFWPRTSVRTGDESGASRQNIYCANVRDLTVGSRREVFCEKPIQAAGKK